ncbi:MAG TPA: FimV/HubP family polar landmark protein [Methylophilaceae bacterium]|nr:FimV/HubP family polar landmark protein [Methylophilaceae bacterium]
MKRIVPILMLCLAMGFFSMAVHPAQAASLGRMTVISDLDQPLIAEVELLGVNVTQLGQYSAQLASEQAYRIQGIEKTPPQYSIRVEVIRKFDDSPVLKLTSGQPLHSRSTNILLQLDWPNGRVMREYALLLEPSQVANSAPVPVDSVVFTKNRVAPVADVPHASSQQTSQTAAQPVQMPGNDPGEGAAPPDTPKDSRHPDKVASERQSPEPKSASTASVMAKSGYTTNAGDTLSRIASRMQVDGVSLDQMLRALYLANKDAFIDGDINKLKVGAELKPPSAADFAAATAPAVTAHSEDWRSYRNQVAQMTADSPSNEAGEGELPSSGKLAAVEDKAEATKPGTRDVLKLSRSERIDEKWLSREAQFEQEKQALEEEVTVRENRLEDANQRIVALEKQVRDLQLLLEKSRQAMSQRQQSAESGLAAIASNMQQALRNPSDGLLAAIGITGLLILIWLMRRSSRPRSRLPERHEPTI